jgi:hypothetical protein
VQDMQNIIGPPSMADAVLSQGPPQQPNQLRETEGNALHKTDHHPRVGQHRRGQQARFVEHHAVQMQFALVRRLRRHQRAGGRRRWPVTLGRSSRPLAGSRTAGVEPPLLQFSRGRSVVVGAALAGTTPPMVPAAAKRTTQIDPAGIAGMSEKPNPTMHTMSHARLQPRVRLQNGVQRRLVAEDQRPGRFVLVPIRPERERLLDRDDKKARFSVTMEIVFSTTSSYPIDAKASTGGARFFLRDDPPFPAKPPLAFPPRRSTIQPSPPWKCLLERRNHRFFFPSSGQFS